MDKISAVVCVLLILVCALRSLNYAGSKNDVKGMTMSMDVLPLTNKDYWDNPSVKVEDFTNELLSDGKEVVVIGAPEHIYIDVRKEFPVVMAGVRSRAFEWKYDFKDGTRAICHNTSTGKTYIGNVFRPIDRKPAVKPSSGFVANDYIIDLRTFLGIPWEPGEYKIWFAYYDILSNCITCKLSESEKVCNSAEEERYFNEVVKSAERRQILVSEAIQYHQKAVYQGNNAGIVIEQVDKGKYIFEINGKLPALSYQRVSQEEQKGILEGVLAVFPLDVVIIRTHNSYQVVTLGIPCYSALENEGEEINGVFGLTINLDKILQGEIVADEEVYLYAFSGGYAAGPVMMDMDGLLTKERKTLKKEKKFPMPTPILGD